MDKLKKEPSVINGIWCNPTCPYMRRSEKKTEPMKCNKLHGKILGWRNGILAACVRHDDDE